MSFFKRLLDRTVCGVTGANATRAAVEHCLDAGYRTIAYLGWPQGSVVGDDRRAGWVAGCDAAGTGVHGPEVVAEQDLDAAFAVAGPLVDLLSPGDAVVCASDVLALGVHQVLVRRGLEPGRHAIRAWHPRLPPSPTHPVELERGAVVRLDLEIGLDAEVADSAEPR